MGQERTVSSSSTTQNYVKIHHVPAGNNKTGKGGENLGKRSGGRGKGGWPSKNPGKPSGDRRDNNPPKGK